jgi:hypothetical protein
MPDDIPTSAIGGVAGCECGRPSRGCPSPAAAGGGTGGIPDIGGIYVRGIGRAGSGDAGC